MAKINGIAKDFGIAAKDLVALLDTVGIKKNVGGTIEGEEYEVFLALITAQNQIENLEDYLAGKATLRSDRPKAEPKAETPAPAPQKTAPATASPAAPKKPAPAPAPEAPKKPEEPRYTVPKDHAAARPQRPAPQGNGAPQRQPAGDRRPMNGGDRRPDTRAPQSAQARPERRKPVSQEDIARRMEQFRREQASRPEPKIDSTATPAAAAQEAKRAQAAAQAAQTAQATKVTETPAAGTAPAKEFKPIKKKEPVDRFSRFERKPGEDTAAKPQKSEKPEKREERKNRIVVTGGAGVGTGETVTVVTAEPKVRIVDTRTTQVDLGRYDERLVSRYATTGRTDRDSGRQKLKKQDTRSQGKNVREKERAAQERIRRMQLEQARKKQLEITVPDTISVGEFASRMKKTAAEVMKKLMMNGMMVKVTDEIDYDTAYLIAEEFNVKVTKEVVVTIEERLFETEEDTDENLVERSPVVCVMGHVDHGKTSLLDAIRHTSVTKGEAGGITQHIGAYRVTVQGKEITFLDTPGHEAFTAMRARGAQATDIAILVVAADDGIMPQTIEAINHAKAAGVDIIVAINKMDKPHANPDQVMQELTKYDLVPEEWGGDVICVPVSALTGMNIDKLLESVLLVAEVKELKANPNRRAKGLVIESRLDKGRGPVATVLVQNGTLHAGDIVIAGTAVGRVRAMSNERGEQMKTAGPSVPAEIIGLSEVPASGDEFNAVEDEKMARSLAEQRREQARQEEFKATARVSLDALFDQIAEGVKTLNIVIKADVGGSAEAVKQSLQKLSTDEVKVNIIHAGVGGVTEGDVMLAAASQAIIVGFNVRPDKTALDSAERQGVDIRTYRVIYDCIDEVQAALKGMLAPKYREVLLGHAECRQTIRVPNVGTIAGCYVLDGKIARHAKIRIVRDGVLICEDEIASLKRFKDDAKEVAAGYECGVGLKTFNDVKVGDTYEAFIMEEIPQ